MRIQLIPDWRQAWRWWSVRLGALAAALPPLWSAIPEDIKSRLPGSTATIGASVIAIAIVIARVLPQQGGKSDGA